MLSIPKKEQKKFLIHFIHCFCTTAATRHTSPHSPTPHTYIATCLHPHHPYNINFCRVHLFLRMGAARSPVLETAVAKAVA